MPIYRIARNGKNFVPYRDDEPLGDALPRGEAIQSLTAAAGMPGRGPGFQMPLIVAENVRIEDGRLFQSLDARPVPLPVMATWATDEGHDGAVLVAQLSSIQRDGTGRWSGAGFMDVSPVALEACRLIANGLLNSVSMDAVTNEVIERVTIQDLTDMEAAMMAMDSSQPITMESYTKWETDFPRATIAGVTILPMPGMADARVILDNANQDIPALAASLENEDCEPCRAAMQTQPRESITIRAAAVATEAPPRAWFDDPQLDGPTPLTVQADGRVLGHAALWGVCHRGISDACVMAPKSSTDYAHFKVGAVLCDDGTTIPTGPLTVGGGHASLSLDARAAARHYDDSGTAAADVAIGEDEHGIWVAGAIRPGATPEQVYALRASSLSGDWRPIGGRLELVAALAVNVPGFATMPYALAASLGWREKDGQMLALVAAGAAPLAQAKTPVTRQELDATLSRLAELESIVATLKPVAVERALARVDADQLTERRNAAVEAARARLSG